MHQDPARTKTNSLEMPDAWQAPNWSHSRRCRSRSCSVHKAACFTRFGESFFARYLIIVLLRAGLTFFFNRGSPPFKFNNRRIHLPECDIYRVTTPNTPDTQPQAPPIIGYFHYDDVTKDREKALTPRLNPRGGFNWPVARLYQRRLHGVTPDLWSQDPYLICLLLSLAQLQWRGEGSKSTTYPVSYLLFFPRPLSLTLPRQAYSLPTQPIPPMPTFSKPTSPVTFSKVCTSQRATFTPCGLR